MALTAVTPLQYSLAYDAIKTAAGDQFNIVIFIKDEVGEREFESICVSQKYDFITPIDEFVSTMHKIEQILEALDLSINDTAKLSLIGLAGFSIGNPRIIKYLARRTLEQRRAVVDVLKLAAAVSEPVSP